MVRVNNKRLTFLIGVFCIAVTSLPAMIMSEKSSYRARVRVYVDKAGVDQFNFDHPGKNLDEHVKKMFVDVNEAYKSLLPTLNVTLKVEQIVAMDRNVFQMIMTGKDHFAVFYDSAGYQFWKWAKKTYDSKVFDLTVLLTGFELYSTNDNPGAFEHAYTGSVCTVSATGVVEIQEPDGTFGLAHAIGHILGAAHDPEAPKKLCGPDSYTDGNLMNEYSTPSSPLRYTFSECSILQISEHIANLTSNNQNCLTAPADDNNDVPALQITADEFCEQKKGKGWEYFRNDRYGDEFCDEGFFCIKAEDDDRNMSKLTPPAGLRCGKSKRCFRNKCFLVTNGDPDMSDYCPWGSQSDDYFTKLHKTNCENLGCWALHGMCCGHC